MFRGVGRHVQGGLRWGAASRQDEPHEELAQRRCGGRTGAHGGCGRGDAPRTEADGGRHRSLAAYLSQRLSDFEEAGACG